MPQQDQPKKKEKFTNKWSTKQIKKLLKFFNREGIMPKHNPFFKQDIKKLKSGIDFHYTMKEWKELLKCRKDILYFANNYPHITTDEGKKVTRMRDYQEKILLQYKKYDMNVLLASRQIGKCVAFDTMVEIYDDLKDVTFVEPIFRVHYRYMRDRNIWDKIEWMLFEMAYFFKTMSREYAKGS